MGTILTYIIQVNLLLSLLFLGYHLLLKNLTFYSLNRIYLLLGSMYAFVYPFLNIKGWFDQKVSIPQGVILEYIPFIVENQQRKLSVNDLLVYLVALGALFFFAKLIIQLFSLVRIHWYSKPSQWREFLFRNVIFPITPFSFFNKVYIHKDQHQELELNDIFKHEYVHVRGHHSIDVLWFELVLLICWYNPLIWMMRKSVRQNLEFLTDQQVLDKGVDRQTYQYSLLNVTKQGAQVGISNQFNFKTLKKRIMMMNKKRSSKLELSKYVFLLPVLILTGITFTVNQAEAKIETVVVRLENADLKQQINEVFVQNRIDTNKVENREEGLNTTKLDSVRIVDKEYADYIEPSSASKKERNDIKGLTVVNLGLSDTSKKPVIVLDGEKMPRNFNLAAIRPEFIEEIIVLKGPHAERYGKDAEENGVLKLTLKKEVNSVKAIKGRGVKEIVVRGREKSNDLTGEVAGLSFNTDSVTNAKFKTNSLLNKINSIPKNAELYIDDQKVPLQRFEFTDPNQISHIEVIKNTASGNPQIRVATFNSQEKASSLPARITVKGEPSDSHQASGIRTQQSNTPTVFAGRSTYRTWSIPEVLSDKNYKDAYIEINGKKSSFKKMNSIDPNNVASMNVLPSIDAEKKFGKKAKGGAIIIATKNK